MKVPYSWLKEFVSVRIRPQELAERLTLIGIEVESVLSVDGEAVLDVAVSPNRGDCLSILGMAREVSALLGVALKSSEKAQAPRRQTTGTERIRVRVEERRGCPRYTLRLFRNVQVGPSPAWMVTRLQQCGIRSINNVVDITNYILLERGQPLHAFDGDRILGGITVRLAREGERLTTLDGVERKLSSQDLLIADQKGGIALAGVMGGKESEVGEGSRVVALECAVFDPTWIRRTAKRLGIVTESSYRFERGVDPQGIVPASERAAALLVRWSGAVLSGDLVDVGRGGEKGRTVELDPERVGQFLGGQWPVRESRRTLIRLGLRPHGRRAAHHWEVPSYRRDLVHGVDLIEEVARLGGYHRIPETLPPSFRMAEQKEGRDRQLADEVGARLSHLGFYEVIHQGFVSPSDCAYDPDLKPLMILNPLGQGASLLRPSLVPSLLKTVATHHQHKRETVRLFELRRVFRISETVQEPLYLGVTISGETLFSYGTGGHRETSFFDLKGVLEGLLGGFGLEVQFTPGERRFLLGGKTAEVRINGEAVGFLGEVGPEAAERFGLMRPTFVGELDWEKGTAQIPTESRYLPFSRHPRVQRDLALVLDEGIEGGKVCEFLRGLELGFIQQVKIFDLYRGSQIPEGKKSLAFSLWFGWEDRTPNEREIGEAWRRIVESVRREFHADIR